MGVEAAAAGGALESGLRWIRTSWAGIATHPQPTGLQRGHVMLPVQPPVQRRSSKAAYTCGDAAAAPTWVTSRKTEAARLTAMTTYVKAHRLVLRAGKGPGMGACESRVRSGGGRGMPR